MVKQPPQLLTRVIRAIAALREPKGSSVSSIITQVRLALNDASAEIPRNITMQVRRALKHAMDNGIVQQRAGRYRVAGKRPLPVDSMELAVDRGRKRRRTGRRRRSGGRRRSSEHDRSRTTRRRRSRRRKSRARAAESQHSITASKPSTAKNPERQATPTNENSASNIDNEHSGTPYPDSKEASPARDGRRRRRRRHRKSRSRNHADGPPTVDDEPMDNEVVSRVRSMPRNMSPRRSSMPQQREQEEHDSLDEIHDRPPSYYN